ncbi:MULTISPECIES: DUF1707 SHOCT-like domain-containing protein [Mycobacterium]|uniref:DUF1707 domain-containing protein n=1 Tax=Mycobacterium kiyosense TaxID=2871094 RepID=A0A9P3Q9C8_9MYCO|nr:MULTISPECIES: DUF1707 domain-containing protein [Mycobacterium]BDE11481.1 hypothetical protein MKCMC460_03410 [Mycobacterium sp. 20KCMC460]GLB83417.1 hypothetical protein SRL2020028_26730 [Mycobacterium kiyosense]GLB88860.1 hypothetical protein SRL2020130_16770 [Mycobacterium kiyosense]GLB97072.1 hypothetical protein SRL2020226_38480 [Mycobacterium kiyosense]GLC03594.1 hypothetical protein SRL2020400_41850 [Mycobacterium kiyosense]
MAIWSGSTSTRAKDTDRQETCQILDNALADGEISAEEHRERVSSATQAVTLGELQRLVTDLQFHSTLVKTPATKLRSPRPGLGLAAAALGVTVLLGIGIGWGLYGNTTSPLDFTSDPGAKSDGVAPVVLTPPRQLHSLGGLTGLMEQTRKRFGDTLGYRLVIYPTYASFERKDPADDRRVLNYTYRGGWGDPSTSAKSSTDTELVDLGKFDVKAVVGVMRGAPETVGIKQSDVKSSYLIVEPGKDPTAPGGLTLTIYVSSDYGSGYIALAGDGTVKQVNYVS